MVKNSLFTHFSDHGQGSVISDQNDRQFTVASLQERHELYKREFTQFGSQKHHLSFFLPHTVDGFRG
jgi:hypothetical protein